MDQFHIVGYFDSVVLLVLIGCGPVQMASAYVSPLLDHSQVQVEFPCAPYSQKHLGNCFSFHWVFLLSGFGHAAQEVCGWRGEVIMARS